MPTIFPELRWAQRSSPTEAEKNKLWITVAVANLESPKVQTTDTTFKFTGKDSEREYAVELELYAEIDANLTRYVVSGQNVVVELRKKQSQAEYWPRLTKDSKRRPFIRTDFDKWVDEDEQDEVPEQDPLAGMGALGGGAGAGDGQFDLSQLQQLQQLQEQMGAGGGLGGAEGLGGDSDEEENDETTSKLGEAQD